MSRALARRILPFALSVLVVIAARTASAQDLSCQRGDLEVRSLKFTGNTAFSSSDLSKIIVTTPSAWARRVLHLPFTVRHCLDRSELPRDRARLIIYYRKRGFPEVQVDTAVRNIGRDGVEVQFRIQEGVPTRLQSLVITGLDSVPVYADLAGALAGMAQQEAGRASACDGRTSWLMCSCEPKNSTASSAGCMRCAMSVSMCCLLDGIAPLWARSSTHGLTAL